MKTCSGCPNAAEIFSLQASLKAANDHIASLNATYKQRLREMDALELEAGNRGLRLKNALQEIRRLQALVNGEEGRYLEDSNIGTDCGSGLPNKV